MALIGCGLKLRFGLVAGLVLAGSLVGPCVPRGRAQAAAIPSAETGADQSGQRGRKLLDEMIAAMGGDTWLHRTTWVEYGKSSAFYKGTPNPDVSGFEEYNRARPFGRRVVIITESPHILAQMFGIPSVGNARDVAVVYTPKDAFLVDYKGKTELPKDELEDYLRRQKYTLDVLVQQWARQPGVLIMDEGTDLVGRRLADKISILTAENQTAVLDLDESTHLPLSTTVQYRDPLYKDMDTDVEQFDNYQTIQGIATPLTITRLHNGDIVSQRFLTRVEYNRPLPDALFDPDLPLQKVKK